jgi:uncharacterized membrane protein
MMESIPNAETDQAGISIYREVPMLGLSWRCVFDRSIFEMTEWYYAHGGQQHGPVSFQQLVDLAASGGLDPVKDLVWNASMKDWAPAGQVDGVFPKSAVAAASMPPADPSNPYSAPQSPWEAPIVSGEEIVPGSDPMDPVEVLKRAFELTKRNFVTILLVGVVYFAVTIGISFAFAIVQGVVGAVTNGGGSAGDSPAPVAVAMILITQILSQVVSLFLGLGVTRIGLDLVSGKQVEVGMLFSQGGKLLRAIGASILFFLMVVVGLLLLIVPGIYLALRYGQYLNAIVDKDLGVMDAFAYSSSITTNNRLNIFLIWLLSIPVILAGMLACFVGLVFAGPMVWLMYLVAYRWMQYGRRAITDQPGTTTPVLA